MDTMPLGKRIFNFTARHLIVIVFLFYVMIQPNEGEMAFLKIIMVIFWPVYVWALRMFVFRSKYHYLRVNKLNNEKQENRDIVEAFRKKKAAAKAQ